MPSHPPSPDNPPDDFDRSAGEGDRHYLWNFIVLTGDAGAWFFATAFLDVITVLPLFFQRMSALLASRSGPLPLFLSASFLTGLALAIRSA
ncbi:MAG: hypothetical protein LC772_07490, partial [Chloroflexi bacterium]|nr:hypothetical protein [Chloroflexota bacterium]